ncbi:MAG: CoA pyrophosphatase [Thermoanaerobaculia bacterium]|nr:CoA pyrophosphatase [Thermoanaerobaculia bacterium]
MTELEGQAYSPWMEDVRKRLGRSWPARPLVFERPPGAGSPPLRPAAVLIPLYVREKALWTLFTKRTDMVEHHKGQISFPGGGKSDGDANLWETAVRETEEEIGVARAGVRILGALPRLVTVTDFEVAPFVGAIPYPVAFAPRPGEVESIIEVPLAYLLDPMVVEERPVKWKGKEVMNLVYHYRGHAIWGATARILADLLTVMRDGEEPGSAPAG